MPVEIQAAIDRVLSTLAEKSVLVLGDYFLDEYLWIDPGLVEISLETGLQAYQVVQKQRQPGAAGTVVNNLYALGVGELFALGVCGADGEGFELKRALQVQRVHTDALVERPDLLTPTYTKPMLLGESGAGQELNRLDAKNRAALPTDLEDRLLRLLRARLSKVDAVIIADQVEETNCGVVTSRIRSEISAIARECPAIPFLADSRRRIGGFHGVLTKPNERELASLFHLDPPCQIHAQSGQAGTAAPGAVGVDEPVPVQELATDDLISMEELAAMGQELSRRTGKFVFVTAGSRGILVCSVMDAILAPGIEVKGPIDVVGAGDSATAGIICALIAGCSTVDAAMMGNIVASITVEKLGTTGTASPDEIRTRASEAAASLLPRSIEPSWRQREILGKRIEIIRTTPPCNIHSAIFDFDGTLSLIREGWQGVMIPFMVEELERLETGEDRDRLELGVREFVFELTGKQTIFQMMRLAEEIARRGGAPRSPQDYKEVYHDRLWQRIRKRVEGLKNGAISRDKLLVPGSIELLDELRSRGVLLYLASGTDLNYVQDEVEALGLGEYFGDQIYAALPEFQKFSKQRIIQQIIRQHSLSGPELVAFGDGYVEIENTREVGGRTVGAATDEQHPGRIDPWKRNRLIGAGAEIIVPDFGEAALLVQWLAAGRKTTS